MHIEKSRNYHFKTILVEGGGSTIIEIDHISSLAKASCYKTCMKTHTFTHTHTHLRREPYRQTDTQTHRHTQIHK